MKPGNAFALAGVALLLAVDARPTPAQQPITLTLGDAARVAAARGLGPEAARSRMDMAAARLQQQRADLLPTLLCALSLLSTAQDTSGNGSTTTGSTSDTRGSTDATTSTRTAAMATRSAMATRGAQE